jgi:outer membrane usher protein
MQEFVQLGLGAFGSVGLSNTRSEFRDRAPVQLLSVQQNVRIGRLGSLSLSVLRVLNGKRDTVATLIFTRSTGPRSSTTLNTNYQAGRPGASVQAQESLPAGNGFGYGALIGTGIDDSRQASFSFQNDMGMYSLEADAFGGSVATRVSASGSVALLDSHVLVGRRINDSFAVAQVPEGSSVELYSDNQPAGRTNSSGYALLSRLRPYQANVIRIDPSALPLDVEIDSAEMTAVPYTHSGVLLRFPLTRPHGALLSIVLESGEPLPAGAVVERSGAPPDPPFPVALHGEAYVTGLTTVNQLSARWGGRTCQFTVRYVATDDPLPRLGPYICKQKTP